MDDFICVTVVAIDNEKRQRNYDFLKRYYKDNNIPHTFIKSESSDYLHLQKIYNDFYKKSAHKIIVKYDVDCIIDVNNLKLGVDTLKKHPKSFVYPFDQVVYIDPDRYESNYDSYEKEEVLRNIKGWPEGLTLKNLTSYIVGERNFKGLDTINFKEMDYASPLGYSYMFNFDTYNIAGLDNEYLLDFNFDDLERYHRLRTLDYNIVHLPGKAFHMDHSNGEIGAKHRNNKQFIVQNAYEYFKIINLDKQELEAYIKTWPWIKN